jgi:hypothetical protein
MQGQKPQVTELEPLCRKAKPAVTDAHFDVVSGPTPPNIVDKLQAFLERSPLAFWLIVALGLAVSGLGFH